MQEGLEPKKLALLRILEILESDSDCDHPLTQQQIADRLEAKFGIALERKAVSRNLQLLEEAGFEIASHDRRGVYLASRRFEDGELRMLIDSVTFSRHIPRKYADDLVEKLRSCGSKYFEKSVHPVRSADMLYRSQAKDIFYIIEQLNDAMANEQQVSFVYNAYGTDKQLHPVWKEAQAVNPYQLVAANNSYYLVGNVDAYDNLTNFRLDKITDLAVIRRPRKSIRSTAAGSIRIGAYLSAHPYMLTGQPVRVAARLPAEKIELAIDAFGDNFTLSEGEGGMIEVSALVNEDDACMWALQNGDAVEIVEPQALRDRIRLIVGQMKRRYLRTDADAYAQAIADARRNGDLDLRDLSVRSRIAREQFARLWRLSLINTDVSDLSFLSAHGGLKVVRLINAPASDFSALASLAQLKKAEIRMTNLACLDFLKGMELEELILADDPIADFTPLYEMKGLSYFTTGTETVRSIDLDRLRAAYPGITVSVQEELEFRGPERYLQPAPDGYPANVLEVVFGESDRVAADEEGLKAFLGEHIPVRLDEAEAEFFFRRFRDGESYQSIAARQGISVYELLMREARVLRKLRHPCSSRQLAKYFLTFAGDEEDRDGEEVP